MGSIKAIESVKRDLSANGFADAPYDRVRFTFHRGFPSRHLIAVGNWDETRRNTIRTVLQEARQNFHRHPRPWWVGVDRSGGIIGMASKAINGNP